MVWQGRVFGCQNDTGHKEIKNKFQNIILCGSDCVFRSETMQIWLDRLTLRIKLALSWRDCDTNRGTACFFLLADHTIPKDYLTSFMKTELTSVNIQDGGCLLLYQALSMNLQLATLSLHLIKHNVMKKRGRMEVHLHAFLLSAPLGTGHFITGRQSSRCLLVFGCARRLERGIQPWASRSLVASFKRAPCCRNVSS